MAQHHAISAGVGVSAAKRPSHGRIDAQQFEEVWRHPRGQDGNGSMIARQSCRPPRVRRNRVEQLAALPGRGQIEQGLRAKTPELAVQADDADSVGMRDCGRQSRTRGRNEATCQHDNEHEQRGQEEAGCGRAAQALQAMQEFFPVIADPEGIGERAPAVPGKFKPVFASKLAVLGEEIDPMPNLAKAPLAPLRAKSARHRPTGEPQDRAAGPQRAPQCIRKLHGSSPASMLPARRRAFCDSELLLYPATGHKDAMGLDACTACRVPIRCEQLSVQ